MKVDLRRLKAERIACGFTQEDVANRLGKKRAWYAKREGGFVSVGADELAAISDVFNIRNIGIFFTNNVPEKEQ